MMSRTPEEPNRESYDSDLDSNDYHSEDTPIPAGKTLDLKIPEGKLFDRLDKVLSCLLPEYSRSQIQRFLQQGCVTSEGVALNKRSKVAVHQPLRIALPPEETEWAIEPWETTLDVLYEDEYLLAINKPAGMVVHPGKATGRNTLVHALVHHCGEQLSQIGAPYRSGIVHRLDRETSGVILCAKSEKAHLSLMESFARRQLHKEYRAIVTRVPQDHSGTIKEPIQRHPVVRTKMSIQKGGRSAHTDWEVLQTAHQHASLLRCIIHTGRTHQIRVHLHHIGHPIVGDDTYGYKASRLTEVLRADRVQLHAFRLCLKHPITGEALDFSAPLPPDMEALLAHFSDEDK